MHSSPLNLQMSGLVVSWGVVGVREGSLSASPSPRDSDFNFMEKWERSFHSSCQPFCRRTSSRRACDRVMISQAMTVIWTLGSLSRKSVLLTLTSDVKHTCQRESHTKPRQHGCDGPDVASGFIRRNRRPRFHLGNLANEKMGC